VDLRSEGMIYLLVFDLQYETVYDGRFSYCNDHCYMSLYHEGMELYVESPYMSHKDLYSIVHFLFPFLVIMFWLYNGSH
jgi:hypothetical protein